MRSPVRFAYAAVKGTTTLSFAPRLTRAAACALASGVFGARGLRLTARRFFDTAGWTRLELAREAGPDRHEGDQVERRREQPHRRLKRTVRCRLALC